MRTHLIRESQEVMSMFTITISVGLTDGDEDVETLMVAADIPFSGQTVNVLVALCNVSS